MPGFIDTHHHQFETALRSFLADGILINDGSNTPSGNTTYFEYILLKFAPVYRPQDVYINELFGGLEPARRRRHDGARHLADPSLARALGRRHPGALRLRGAAPPSAISRARASISDQPGQPVSERRGPHQAAVVLVERPARPHDHGRRGLSRGPDLHDRPGRSGASSVSRLRRTSSRRSASARSWTISPRARAASTATSGSDPTTCSST